MAHGKQDDLEVALAGDATYIKVAGPGGTGKTQAIVQRVANLLAQGCNPADILVFGATPASASALRKRIAACGEGADEVRVDTVERYCVEMLSSEEAVAVTGRTPRVLADFEERILMEDMKVTGMKPRRLREMLKFFYRMWTELADEGDGFIIEREEQMVHDTIIGHLKARRAMLRCEVSNIAFKFLNGGSAGAACWRKPYVLADNFENLNCASQRVIEQLCTKSLMICGDENQVVQTTEPYPYPKGFVEFEQTHEGVRAYVLEQSRRMPRRIAAMAKSFAQNGELGDISFLDEAGAPSDGDVRFVRWVYPNEEFRGIAGFVKRSVLGGGEERVVKASDIFIAVPNGLWGRAISKLLRENHVKTDVVMNYAALAGDPRDLQKCEGARIFTALNLVADPYDCAAWRNWCGFGDYLTHSNHWCRLEEYAVSAEIDVVDALERIAQAQDVPFLGADVLAQHYEQGRRIVDRLSGEQGFALVNGLVDGIGAAALPPDFAALIEPVSGVETARELLERARGRLENTFADVDAVRIGHPQMALGLEFKTVIFAGAVDGFYPPGKVYDVSCEEDEAARLRSQDHRDWYTAFTKASQTFVLSAFLRDEVKTAAALGMNIHRVRSEKGKSLAIIGPSPYADEFGAEAPGFDAGF